jgi:hypothetical protein
MAKLPYTDFDIGPSIIVYKVPPGTDVPKRGELIPTRNGEVLVTESNSAEGYIKVMIINPKPLSDRFDEYRIEVEAAMEHSAQMIYERTSTGLSAKIGWEALPDTTKAEYYQLAYDIIIHLDIKSLLLLPYE